jgi:hypothetical protein
MKFEWRNVYENYLSFKIASIASVYFWNLLHSGLKYPIHFILIDVCQKLLQAIEKSVIFNHMNIFKLLFHGMKQTKVAESQIKWIRWIWHTEYIVFFKSLCRNLTCANWAVINMNYKLFLILCSSSRKDRLFKWTQYMYHKVFAVHFDIILELADNVEVARILHDDEHQLLLLISGLGFVTMLFLARVHMQHGDMLKKIITHHRSRNEANHLVWHHTRRMISPLHIFSFFAQLVHQQMQNSI